MKVVVVYNCKLQMFTDRITIVPYHAKERKNSSLFIKLTLCKI